MTQAPTFLVQTSDGVLHAYWSADVLRIDLATRDDADDVTVYVSRPGIRLTYRPATQADLRELHALAATEGGAL